MAKQYNDYYTYAYLREDKTPYYIGKGRGRRIHCTQRTIKPPKDKSLILFLKKGLTEAEAFKHEIYMIFVLGRKDLGTGILRNRTNGGDGASGHIKSEEAREKISVANTGKTRTKAQKQAQSGEKNPMYGVPHTDEWKQAQSERMSGRFLGALSPTSKAIIAIEPDGTQRHYGSIGEAARELKMNRGNLRRYSKYDHALTKGDFEGWQFLSKNSENF